MAYGLSYLPLFFNVCSKTASFKISDVMLSKYSSFTLNKFANRTIVLSFNGILILISGCMKKQNLKTIFKQQGYQKFRQLYAEMSMPELLKAVWNYDITICMECGCSSMVQLGRTHVPYS